MSIWCPTVVSQHLSKSDKRGWLIRWPPRSLANPIWHSGPLCLHWSVIVPLCFHLLKCSLLVGLLHAEQALAWSTTWAACAADFYNFMQLLQLIQSQLAWNKCKLLKGCMVQKMLRTTAQELDLHDGCIFVRSTPLIKWQRTCSQLTKRLASSLRKIC